MSYIDNNTTKSPDAQQKDNLGTTAGTLNKLSTGCNVYTVFHLDKNEKTWTEINNLLKPLNAVPYDLGWYIDRSRAELIGLQDKLPNCVGPIQRPEYESFEDLKKSLIANHLELDFRPYDSELKNLKKTESLKSLALHIEYPYSKVNSI